MLTRNSNNSHILIRFYKIYKCTNSCIICFQYSNQTYYERRKHKKGTWCPIKNKCYQLSHISIFHTLLFTRLENTYLAQT